MAISTAKEPRAGMERTSPAGGDSAVAAPVGSEPPLGAGQVVERADGEAVVRVVGGGEGAAPAAAAAVGVGVAAIHVGHPGGEVRFCEGSDGNKEDGDEHDRVFDGKRNLRSIRAREGD